MHDGPASVTETQWLQATDAESLLWLVRERRQTRKLRLFACACCRRIWHLLPSVARRAVVAAELYADRLIKDAERQLAYQDLFLESLGDVPRYALWAAGFACIRGQARDAIRRVVPSVANAAGHAARLECGPAAWMDAEDTEEAAALALVREVFGNPFRLPSIDPALFAWNDGTIPRLAQAAYDQRHLPDGTLDEARLAILADALEDAGCADTCVAHLREPGPHVRGCWVVD